jgi:hypothetical protein
MPKRTGAGQWSTLYMPKSVVRPLAPRWDTAPVGDPLGVTPVARALRCRLGESCGLPQPSPVRPCLSSAAELTPAMTVPVGTELTGDAYRLVPALVTVLQRPTVTVRERFMRS